MKRLKILSISLLVTYCLLFILFFVMHGTDDFALFLRLGLSWLLPLLLAISFISEEKRSKLRLISVSFVLLIIFGVLHAFARFILLFNNPYYSFVNDFLTDIIFYVLIPGIFVSIIGSLIFVRRQQNLASVQTKKPLINWKTWPYWLRGGILSITPLSAFLLVIFLFPDELMYFLLLLSLPNYWIAYLTNYCIAGESCLSFWVYALLPLDLIEIFLIGSLIGWVYGKIKEKSS